MFDWSTDVYFWFVSFKLLNWKFSSNYIFTSISKQTDQDSCVSLTVLSLCTTMGITGIFFWGGKVIFPDFFFPAWNAFFLVKNSHFGRPKTNFRRFQKWKAKKQNKNKTKQNRKKKKKVLTSIYSFSYFRFQFSTFPFTIFLPFSSIFTPFSFFHSLFFPDTSAKISPSEVPGGHSAPCPPPPVMPLCITVLWYSAWWAKTGNLGSSFLGNLSIWR